MSGSRNNRALSLLDALHGAYLERDELQERIDRLLEELYAHVRSSEPAGRSSGHRRQAHGSSARRGEGSGLAG
jgi:hypothetical protein